MRRALIVGIDDYPKVRLEGCVRDAERMTQLLAEHADGSRNFDCRTLVAPGDKVDRNKLAKQIEKLFEHPAEVALFYFAGHGSIHKTLGGFIFAQDSAEVGGINMRDVLSFALKSPVHEVILIFDSCFSGAFGQSAERDESQIVLREGMSVLTATRAQETAGESGDGGVFTALLCEALRGGAADLRGTVTVPSLYAFVDQTLDAWEQRPMLKSYVSQLLPLRRCAAAVELPLLRKLPQYFDPPDFVRSLDPSYEPTAEPRHSEHEAIFADLQRLRAVGLVEPTGGEAHMYYAAMNSKGCRLTALGQFYRQLAEQGQL